MTRAGLLVTVCATLLGCATRLPLTVSSMVPAATASLQISTDKNNNTEIELSVRNLANPLRLSPAKSSYAVWIQRSGQPAELQGQIQVDDDLEGRFKTVTPYKSFEVFVTAEESLTPQVPSRDVVMNTVVDVS